MKGHFAHSSPLTDSLIWLSLFLTFVSSTLFPTARLYAFDNSADSFEETLLLGKPAVSTLNAQNHQLGLVKDYLRREGPRLLPALLPGLPSIFTTLPTTWMKDRGLELGVSLNSLGLGEEETMVRSLLASNPLPEQSDDFRLSPSYHHKGFLPLNDALVLGINSHRQLLDDKIQFDLHPYYAQGACKTQGYWGTEMAVNLASSDTKKPWGKIALSYANGASTLMDHNQGLDIHSELTLTESLTLNTGIRDKGNGDQGNYVMLRWKLVGE